MISVMPDEKKVSSATLVISVAMHALLIGGAGISFDRNFDEMHKEEHSVVIQIEKPPLLPKIDIMSEEKKVMEVLEKVDMSSEIEDKNEAEDICPQSLVEDMVTEDISPVEICRNKDIINQSEKENEKDAQDEDRIDIPEPDEEAMLRYQDMVKQKIESRRRYPSWARRQNMEGVSYIVFTVLPDGRAVNIFLTRSSGYTILDNEALATIERASPFPPIPVKLSSGGITMELEIVFAIT